VHIAPSVVDSDGGGALVVLRRQVVFLTDGCFLDGGAGLLRLMNHLFGYLGSALIFMPYIIGGRLGVLQQSPISTAFRMPLAHFAYIFLSCSQNGSV